MITRISVSRIPGADRNMLVAKLRFHKGVGQKVAQRVADGETVTIDVPSEEVEKIKADGIVGKFTVTIVNDNPAPKAETQEESTMEPEVATDEALPADEAELIRRILKNKGISERRVIELIREHATRPATVEINISGDGFDFKGEAAMHFNFPYLVTAVKAGVNVMLVGPAGSGKTTAASKVAELLGLEFHATGALDNAYKLAGFIDAQGRIIHTAFRKAFEHGGLFLFDEMDGSMASALLAFNSALANDWYDFPDANVKRHPNFRVIAGANTYGTGADRQYVGRNQLDAASLDRYAILEWGYDEALEASFIGLPAPKGSPIPKSITPLQEVEARGASERFFHRVVKVRKAVSELKVRHVVSPRATINGSKLLACGWDWNTVEEAVIWKGMDADTKAKVVAKAN